jgi:hypothetical protein
LRERRLGGGDDAAGQRGEHDTPHDTPYGRHVLLQSAVTILAAG